MLNRLDQLLTSHAKPADELASELATGRYYLATAERRIRRNLDELWSNDDAETTRMADLACADHKRRSPTTG